MDDDKNTFLRLLADLDFSAAEAQTYRALLELEAVSVRKVAAQSGINRGTTYDAIKRLVTAGLVRVRRSGVREYFSAESPDKIYDLIREKRKELWQTQQRAQRVIPELLATTARPQGRPIVRYYEDDEGVVAVLKDVLQTCGRLPVPAYYAYSSRPLRQYLYRKFPQFTERRVKEGITVQVIAIGEGGEPSAASDRRWLPEPNEADISSYTIIYGDKVANISISSDYTPYAVVVEDAGAAAMQKLLFRQLWDTLRGQSR